MTKDAATAASERVVFDDGRSHMRVYPDPTFPKYYETCSHNTFRRYFTEE